MEIKITLALRSHIASWLSHLDNGRLARTCTRWHMATDALSARETLDLRAYPLIGPQGVPEWCWILLRCPKAQVARSWRRLFLPDARVRHASRGRIFTEGRHTREAYAVLVALMRRAEYAYNVWCTVNFARMLRSDAERQQPRASAMRFLSVSIIRYCAGHLDEITGKSSTHSAEELRVWSSHCQQLNRIEFDHKWVKNVNVMAAAESSRQQQCALKPVAWKEFKQTKLVGNATTNSIRACPRPKCCLCGIRLCSYDANGVFLCHA